MGATDPTDLTSDDVAHGRYLPTSALSYSGRVLVNARLLAQLATGRDVPVLEGDTREALLSAGWVEEVTPLHVRAVPALVLAYAAARPEALDPSSAGGHGHAA